MVRREAKVKSRYGIHARPSAAIAKVAIEFPDTEILIIDTEDKQIANARSILDIMMLALFQDEVVIVSASGKDEELAVATIVGIIETFEVEVK